MVIFHTSPTFNVPSKFRRHNCGYCAGENDTFYRFGTNHECDGRTDGHNYLSKYHALQ